MSSMKNTMKEERKRLEAIAARLVIAPSNETGDYLAVYAAGVAQGAIDSQQWTSVCMLAQVPYTLSIADFERLHNGAPAIDVKLV